MRPTVSFAARIAASVLVAAPLSFTALFAAEKAPEQASPPAATVLSAARLWDGRAPAPLAHGLVVIQEGKIVAVGAGVTVPQGATRIELGDVTLLPGFIDSHTHVTGEMSANFLQGFYENLKQTVPEQSIRATVFAKRLLDAGFTTIRNVGADHWIDVGLRDAIAAGVVPGPRMLVSAHALSARGGHCDNGGFPEGTFGEESGIKDGIASGADQFRDAVRYQIKYGADLIKVCATGGVLSLNDSVDAPQVTQDEMNAIVDEAHRLERRVAVHAHGAEGAKVAIRAGADSIEHGSFLDDEALRMMKEKGTWLVPTLLAGEYATKGPGAASLPPQVKAKAAAAMAKRSDTFKKALALGVKVAFGTDSGVSPHGVNAQEFALLVAHGMSAKDALATATLNAATLLGIVDRTGTLEPGKAADVIAVAGDPFADIHATEHVVFVMKGGVIEKTIEKSTEKSVEKKP